MTDRQLNREKYIELNIEKIQKQNQRDRNKKETKGVKESMEQRSLSLEGSER